VADPQNENRHFLDTHATDKGIVRVVVAGTEMPPGILPSSGALRTTPSALYGGVDAKGNRTGK
jgi:hypothetical protein